MPRKEKNQRHHAKQRAIERYGVWLTNADYDRLCAQIRNQKAEFLSRQTNRITLYRVRFEDRDLYAAYDKKRHVICSFLTPEQAMTSTEAMDEWSASQSV